ncbi:MAG TPA: exodeoxyribonuclease VII large subunit, partial [Acholeplasmataceae bacterium]|nr:exodeoxyribonuclease VII large subunit [Acholeplasmataceae bacterium]
MENKYLTVTALNRYIAYKFETDVALRQVYVKGEISNFRISGGHLYFSLKDENSEIRAIMFAGYARSLKFMPEDGMTVLVNAQVKVYEKGGTYSLNVFEMQEIGRGEIYLNFLRLKEKLQKEGLFDEEKKLPLPEWAEHVGVITSPTGDALQDILKTIKKRWPLTRAYLYPALVQGKEAPASLIAALQAAQKNKLLDVIIIARGGGSAEDLSCFNDEGLARAVFASRIPTVSGVGHESDFTIIDFVTSRRAPTPTGAAVLVTKDQYQVIREVNEKLNLIQFYYKKLLEKKYYDYQNLINRHHFKNFSEVLALKEKELERLEYNLRVHSPLATIERYLQRAEALERSLKVYNLPERISRLLEAVAAKEKN